MATSDLAYEKWERKRREYDVFEEECWERQKFFEQKRYDLEERYQLFQSFLDDERHAMMGFLYHFEEKEDISDYEHKLWQMEQESQDAFRQEVNRLDDDEEEFSRTRNKQRLNFEESIEQLRRDYARTLE